MRTALLERITNELFELAEIRDLAIDMDEIEKYRREFDLSGKETDEVCQGLISNGVEIFGRDLQNEEEDDFEEDIESTISRKVASEEEEKGGILYRTPVEVFLAEARKYNLLTREQEYELATKARKGDEKAKNELCYCNFRLVYSIANQYYTTDTRARGRGLGFEDLISCGCLGLSKAVDKYDPDISKFSTYATYWIRQAIMRELDRSDTIRLPENAGAHLKEVRRFIRNYRRDFDCDPSDEEIMEGTGLSELQYKNVKGAMKTRTVDSLDRSINENEGEERTLSEVVPDSSRSTEPENCVESAMTLKWLVEYVPKHYSERDADIFLSHAGLKGNGDIVTLDALAERHGLSRERVRQIYTEMVKELGPMIGYAQKPKKKKKKD